MELEEAIKYFENFTNYTKDVWKKEQKEKFDKKYEQDLCKRVKMFELLLKYIKEESIPKEVVEEKISWKPISKYNRKNYDWVLVKYFDGDYECVPEVAERRSDGKWYTSEKEIPFEVKYFFDMQEILNKGE